MTSKQQQPPPPAEELDDDALLAHLDDLDLHDMIIDDDSSEEGGITTSDLENSGLQAYENHHQAGTNAEDADFQHNTSTTSPYETTNTNTNTNTNGNKKHSTSAASTANSSSHYSSARGGGGGGYASEGGAASVFSAEPADIKSQATTTTDTIHIHARTTSSERSRAPSVIMSVDDHKRNRGTSVTSVVNKHPEYVAPQAQSQMVADNNMDNMNVVDDENNDIISIDIATLRHPQDFYNLGAKLLEKSRTEGAAKSAAVARANYLKYMNRSSGGGSSAKSRRSVVPP